MNLFEYALGSGLSVYPRLLGYYYFTELTQEELNDINKYDFVFIESDIPIPLKTKAIEFHTSADMTDDMIMWLNYDFSNVFPFCESEESEVPSVGFVGRCPILPCKDKDGNPTSVLHKGFENRYFAIQNLGKSMEVCTDFHVRYEPVGDSAGFYNRSIPTYKKDGPLFKNNMLANQYQICARGNANWSIRFYETLAYGRIPIYVDSGGKFPLNADIGPDDVPFLWVKDVQNIEQDLLEFHQSMRSMKLTQIQCRSFYLRSFTFKKQIQLFSDIWQH